MPDYVPSDDGTIANINVDDIERWLCVSQLKRGNLEEETKNFSYLL